MGLQQQQAELINANMELKEEIQRLEDMLEVREKLEFHHNCYWIRNGDNSLDGRFDSIDWDNERKLVRLHLHSKNFNRDQVQLHEFYGKSCKQVFVPLEFLEKNSVQLGHGKDKYSLPTARSG